MEGCLAVFFLLLLSFVNKDKVNWNYHTPSTANFKALCLTGGSMRLCAAELSQVWCCSQSKLAEIYLDEISQWLLNLPS